MKRTALLLLTIILIAAASLQEMHAAGVDGNGDTSATAAIAESVPTDGADEARIVNSDSVRIAELMAELADTKASEAALRLQLSDLAHANSADSIRRAAMRQHIDSLKLVTPGWAVVVNDDTLFTIYAKQGGLSPQERAEFISHKIESIGKYFTLQPDSVYVSSGEYETDVVYGNEIILSVTQIDALWANQSRDEVASATRGVIVEKLKELKAENSIWRLVKRILSFVGIVLALYLFFKLVNKGYRRLVRYFARLRQTRLRPIYIQKVELLDTKKQLAILIFTAKILRAVVDLMMVLLVVPLVFSLFPQTRELANLIVGYIWSPIYEILKGIVAYIPNLFTIAIICIVIKYIVKMLRYFAREIAAERISISGFFPEWAMPTFYIARFLLYAFMVAMIYPYLPGSSSGVFQGISVFVGLIVSLGSSSVIGNLMAGLVITYMRPFKMGDRVEVKDMTGDVIEKTPFVTRLLTPKNEVVTIPNSFVMSSMTINFSKSAQQYGLIIHTDVTMGYEIPWRKINAALIEAALNTPGVVDDPRPFVLQTSLGDDYTVYQLNAYIRNANRLPDVYSDLHENIQDIFNREGMELLSPRYTSVRDGNASTLCRNREPRGDRQKGEQG